MKDILLLLALLPSAFGFAGVGEACYEQVTCGADLTIDSLTMCSNCGDCEDLDSCEYCESGSDAGLDTYYDTCTDMDEVDFDASIYGMYSCNGTRSGYPVYLQYSDSTCTSLVAEQYYICECGSDDDDEEENDGEDCGVYSTWACNGTSFTTMSDCDSDSCDNCEQEYTFEESPWGGDWDCFSPDESTDAAYGFMCMDSGVMSTVYSDDTCISPTSTQMLGCDEDCDDDEEDERRRLKDPSKILDGSKEVKRFFSPRTKKQVTKSIRQFKKKSSQLHSTKK